MKLHTVLMVLIFRFGVVNLACVSSKTHNLQPVFLRIYDTKGVYCARCS